MADAASATASLCKEVLGATSPLAKVWSTFLFPEAELFHPVSLGPAPEAWNF